MLCKEDSQWAERVVGRTGRCFGTVTWGLVENEKEQEIKSLASAKPPRTNQPSLIGPKRRGAAGLLQTAPVCNCVALVCNCVAR